MSTLLRDLIAAHDRVLADIYRAETEAQAVYPKWLRTSDIPETNQYTVVCYGPGGGGGSAPPQPALVTASGDLYEARMVNYPGFWPGYVLPKEERPTLPAPAPAVAPPRCECGSGEANCHSDWCPMWRKDGR